MRIACAQDIPDKASDAVATKAAKDSGEANTTGGCITTEALAFSPPMRVASDEQQVGGIASLLTIANAEGSVLRDAA